MSRRYLVRPLPPPGPGDLPAEVARHLAVVRVRPGARVVLFDGAGLEAAATVVEVGRRVMRAAIEPARQVRREPSVHVELACAIPKGTRADWLFEHGTEVGIAVFRPVRFARTPPATRGDRQDRWERITAAATAQCDRSQLPRVLPEASLQQLITDTSLPRERYLAAPGADAGLGAAVGRACVLVVGPEGGLTEDEVALLAAAGFGLRDLGPLTLRTETAGLVGAARLLA